MKILVKYLKEYRYRVLGALLLAATNQVFSLMDPYIFRKIIDDVAGVYHAETHTIDQFVNAIWPLALASVGVAFVSRVAKNFQDYVINTVLKKLELNYIRMELDILLNYPMKPLKTNDQENP